MKNNNLDSISNIKIVKRKRKLKPTLVDALVRMPKITLAKDLHFQNRNISVVFWQKVFNFKLAFGLGVFVLAFSSGMYFTWSTGSSQAEEVEEIALSQTENQVPTLPVVAGASALGPINLVPNEVLFNLTLDQLEAYLKQALKTPEMKEAEILAERKAKLKQYLEDKKSPLVEIVNTIAELKHWKLVLAISNSESSLGRRCYENNCSGIGVEPGHPLWRSYNTKAEWAKDLDKLLGRRYKDWTLEKMNGVYNQPGSQNWLMASKQILEEMQERGIE